MISVLFLAAHARFTRDQRAISEVARARGYGYMAHRIMCCSVDEWINRGHVTEHTVTYLATIAAHLRDRAARPMVRYWSPGVLATTEQRAEMTKICEGTYTNAAENVERLLRATIDEVGACDETEDTDAAPMAA